AFRLRVWSIGGEGQLYVGALGAAGLGLYFHSLPAPAVVFLMVAGGVMAGSLWAAIPGVLRAYLNTNEILTSLMLNYVARALMYYLVFDSTSYWRDLTLPAARGFPRRAVLPAPGTVPGLHLSRRTLRPGLGR